MTPDSPAVAAARSVVRARRLAGDASAPRIEIGSGRPGGFEAAPAGKRASEPREAASDDSGAIATDLSETGGPSSVGGSVPAPDSAAAASGDADPYGATPGLSGRSQPESAAARLRAAADLLEQRAATAPPDIWRLEHVRRSLDKWVALMSPDLAVPLAAWLRDESDRLDKHVAALEAYRPDPVVDFGDEQRPEWTADEIAVNVAHHWRHELAVADLILGGAR